LAHQPALSSVTNAIREDNTMLSKLPFSTRTLLVLCPASLCWAFGFGVGAPLASLWLRDAGCSGTVIGLNTGIYYLGTALAAGPIPWMMRRWGRNSVVAGVVASALTVALFPWGGSLFGWFLLRLLNGMAGALSLIPMETLINRNALPEKRARDFGYYALSVALGVALGALVGVPLYAQAPRTAFVIGGCVNLVAAGLLLGWLPWPRMQEEKDRGKAPLSFSRHFLSFGSAWSQGFLEGAMMALLPIYLLAIGLSEAGAGGLMSGMMIGVILCQVPVAWLADRLGRTTVLLGCYAVTAASLGVLFYGTNLPGLATCLFLAGGCSSAFYPLGLTLLGERLHRSALAHAGAWYLAINCCGSLIGPVLAGVALDQFGNQAIFITGLAAVLLIPAAWACQCLVALLRGPGSEETTRSESYVEDRQAALVE
jgi:MFS family permease